MRFAVRRRKDGEGRKEKGRRGRGEFLGEISEKQHVGHVALVRVRHARYEIKLSAASRTNWKW